jgi:predicted hydrolase (HD superfamily)
MDGLGKNMTRDDALAKLHEWVQSPALLRHMYTVEHVMTRAAPRYGGPDADPNLWAITGLLHDADYEKFPDEHPQHIIAWLRERGEEEIAYAVSAHSPRWGFPCRSALDKSLLACDEITGFVVACTWLRPDGIATLEAPSVLKKLKDKKFAAGVNREEVKLGAELLGVDLGEHIAFVIGALKERAEEFGLTAAR